MSLYAKLSTDHTASHRMLMRELDYAIENMKLKLCDKLDNVKESCMKHIQDSSINRVTKRIEPIHFNADALKTFEKVLSTEIETFRFDLLHGSKPFCPSIVDSVEVPANIGFNYGANVYNQKHNMIIACPSNSSMHFYDATDLSALKLRRKKQISSSVVQMSYWAETDTHLMGCAFGDIYTYNAGTHHLTKVLKEGDSFILAITHLNSDMYAFSSSKSGKLFIGSIQDNESTTPLYSKDSDAWYLHHLHQKKILLSGLANGKIAIYKTNNPSNVKMVDSLQGHKFGKYVTVITTVTINKKEYIITGGNDHTIKIWHFIKGKMRLLKVIQNNEDVSTIVYLENYKMIASTHHRDYIKFFKMPFGTLEKTLPLGLNKARNIFLMKDKNLLGVADLTRNVIKVVQLHPNENSVLNAAR